MTVSNYQVRRATVDDLVVLRRLWQQANFSVDDLEKRLTEFQVVETADGNLLGAIALRSEGGHGYIHSESYRDREQAQELRPRLWERLQSLARNHGLTRLWMENGTSMFWLEHGFEAAGQDLIARLPSGFSKTQNQPWLTLKLRDEKETTLALEQEFALFKESQRQESAAVARQARVLRWVAGGLVCLVMALIAWSVWQVLWHVKRVGR